MNRDEIEKLLNDHLSSVRTALDSQLDGISNRLNAIHTRLDEQDASHDRLLGKVDRMSSKIDSLSILSQAGEEAMTSLDGLSRRVAKIEAAMRGKEE